MADRQLMRRLGMQQGCTELLPAARWQLAANPAAGVLEVPQAAAPACLWAR